MHLRIGIKKRPGLLIHLTLSVNLAFSLESIGFLLIIAQVATFTPVSMKKPEISSP